MDLTILQRVNTTWRDIVQLPLFQEKLFLPAKVSMRNVPGDGVKWNPALEITGGRPIHGGFRLFCNGFGDRFLQRRRPATKALDLREGSWHGMHITQPPSTHIFLHPADLNRSGVSSDELVNANGVTLEQLSRIINKVIMRWWSHHKEPDKCSLRISTRKLP